MTKKRLADLLREEAQKPADPETEAIQEVDRDQPLEPDVTLSETELLQEATVPLAASLSAAPRAKRSSTTKADLEVLVAELREVVQEARRNETSLQEQITDLQTALQEQKALVQKLQAELEQAGQFKTELERAKEVIRQLSEANSQKAQDVNPSSQSNKGLRPHKLSLKKLPHDSIQPGSQSSKLSDADVGWVD